MATPIINTNLGKVVTATGNIADDLSTLRPLLKSAIFSAYATDKVENAPIASFPDGADDVPMKSATFAITPMQDLHGYDSPWPAGGGKNISPTKSGSSDANGRLLVSDIGTIIEGQTYTVSLKALEVNAKEVRVQIDSNNQGAFNASTFVVGQRVSTTFTANASGTLRLNTNNAAFSASTNVVDDIQLELGSTATSYAPYSNICPISGFTGAEITDTNDLAKVPFFKGLLDGTYGFADMGSKGTWSVYNADANQFRLQLTDAWRAGTAGTPVSLLCSKYTLANDTIVGISGIEALTDGQYVQVASSNARYVFKIDAFSGYTAEQVRAAMSGVFLLYKLETPAAPTITDAQLNTILKAFSAGYAIDITWSDAAGTVYGGTIAYLGGDSWRLTATNSIDIYDGTESWTASGGNDEGFYHQNDTVKRLCDYTGSILCDRLKTYSRNGSGGYAIASFGITGYGGNGYPNQNWIYAKAEGATSVAEFKAWLTANPITVVYTLATPVTYDLTGEELATVLGNNNVFANCGDVINLEYRADTALYIEKKLAE